MNNMIANLMKYLVGALMILGLSGTAAANGCLSDFATFTSNVEASTNCAVHDMAGCAVGSGGAGCTYTGSACDFEVVVSPPVGTSTDNTTSYSVINPGFGNPTCQVKIAMTQSNQGRNYCLNIYPGGVSSDTLTTTVENIAISHKKLVVCSDEKVAGLPAVSLEKTVVRVVDGEYDCNEATDDLEVIAPTEVAFCYTVANGGQGAIEDLSIVDDNGTPADASDDFTLLGNGTGLSGGGTLAVDSGPVTVMKAGELINTATASGTYQGVQCSSCSDSDTATVNVVVACNEETQTIANQTGQVVESRAAEGTLRCSPAQDNSAGNGTRSLSLLCDGSCELRPECVDSPIACPQPCKPSGNWTYEDEAGACFFAEPSPGKLPLCQEVLTNPNNSSDCGVIHNPALVRSDGHSSAYSSNPLLYYFPSSGGGNSIGTIYCILLPGENASVCPSGSYVY